MTFLIFVQYDLYKIIFSETLKDFVTDNVTLPRIIEISNNKSYQ